MPKPPMVWFSLGDALWSICMEPYKEPIQCDDGEAREFNGFEVDLKRDLAPHLKRGDRIKVTDGDGACCFWDWDGERFHKPYHPEEQGPAIQCAVHG